jgi:UDP-4-amino-4,6-dideoxy-N-acetyl-beta-L-altrosamine N-acetyltransferase
MPLVERLRRIEVSDLALMRRWRNSPEVASKMYTRHEIPAEEHRDWWKRVCTRDDQTYFMYENAGAPLGVVSFTQIDIVNSNCFWAFYASPRAPKGTGSRMEFLALEYVFSTLKLHKLSCEVLAFNSPVLGLHNKFGFKQEGTFRQHHKMDDAYVDIIRLGIFGDEWTEIREKLIAKFNIT